jgi:hypothetical protein
MAILIKGWKDDSRDKLAWAVAGFVGFIDQWDDFEQSWQLLLDTHEVPYLHMREFADAGGPYAKWYPPQEHREELAAFFADVAKVIGRCGIQGFGAITRLSALERFNAERGLNLQAYPLAVYGSLISLYQRHPREPVELVFDHVEKVLNKLATAKEYADSDQHYAGDFDRVQLIPLNKCWTFREVRPLQAADFLVWEYRKNHVQREGWWAQEGKPDDWDARWADFEAWMERENPRTRKSILALLERTAFTGFVWDYDRLCEADQKRGGRWA